MYNNMTGWTPKLTQEHMKQTPSTLRSLSNNSKQTAVLSISTQLSARQPMSMIQHNEQQSNEANKKQAAKSTNMNDDNRSMLHTF